MNARTLTHIQKAFDNVNGNCDSVVLLGYFSFEAEKLLQKWALYELYKRRPLKAIRKNGFF